MFKMRTKYAILSAIPYLAVEHIRQRHPVEHLPEHLQQSVVVLGTHLQGGRVLIISIF
jgi:hypothetical protein